MADTPLQWELLCYLKQKYGGVCAKYGPYKWDTPRARARILWRLDHQKAAELSRQLLPHLFIKKRQAEIVVRYAELMKLNRGQGSRYEKPESIEEKAKLYKELRKLNKRGR